MAEVFAQNGKEFYDMGMEQFNDRIIGETAAKTALLTGFVTGLNVALVGPPGGGKTTLAGEAYRLIDGFAEENVARVPHHSDLTPQQLIGGVISNTIETSDEESSYVQTTTARIKPIIHSNTQVIWLDELNRVNPFAVNAVLGALENGRVTTDAGEVQLKGLELAISTQNPSETRQATFPVAAATASRHAIGAYMGAEEKTDDPARDARIDQLFDGWESSDTIAPVIDLEGLHEFRRQASGLVIATSAKQLGRPLVKRTVELLSSHSINEADSRITRHVAKAARGLALLNGETAVQEYNLRDAVGQIIAARLGIAGARGNLGQAISTAVSSVVDRI